MTKHRQQSTKVEGKERDPHRVRYTSPRHSFRKECVGWARMEERLKEEAVKT